MNLDVYSTVMEMRSQRMKMVETPQQYLDIFKCLRDEVTSREVDGYYDLSKGEYNYDYNVPYYMERDSVEYKSDAENYY